MVLLVFLPLGVFPVAQSQEISPEEAQKLLESVDRLRDLLPRNEEEEETSNQPLRVRLVPERVRVFQWEKSIRLFLEVTGARNLSTFAAFFEFSPKLSVPTTDFVFPGPLSTQYDSVETEQGLLPSLTGTGMPGMPRYATVLGMMPEGVSGDGTLMGIELSIRQEVEESSAWVRIDQLAWMPEGASREWQRARVLGSTQVEVVYQKPTAYLSFLEPEEGTPSEGQPRLQKQVAAGSTFPVYLCVQGMNDVTGLSFSLDFDPGALSYVGIREGPMIRSAGRVLACFDAAERVNRSGRLQDQGVALLDPEAGLRGGGCIAEILFRTEDGFPSTAEIELKQMASVDPGREPREQIIDLRNPGIPLTVSRLR
jgi:hypothetical protein